MWIRRTLDRVEATVVGVGSTAQVATIPSGWQSSGPWGDAHANAHPVGILGRAESATGYLYFPEPRAYTLRSTLTNSATARALGAWVTSQAWPSTLPGTPA